jgi:hypothetical protein
MFQDTPPCSQLKAYVSDLIFSPILRTEEQGKQEYLLKQMANDADFLLDRSSSQKREATHSSENSVDSQRATWSYIHENRNRHNHLFQNLNSYKSCLGCFACSMGSIFLRNILYTSIFIYIRFEGIFFLTF